MNPELYSYTNSNLATENEFSMTKQGDKISDFLLQVWLLLLSAVYLR